jgi:hypothetical protein
MHDDERRRIADATGITGREAVGELDDRQQGESLLDPFADDGSPGAEIAEELLQQRPRIPDRQLWRALAASRGTGRVGSPTLDSEQLASCHREKLRKRILALIGRLPAESIEDFTALVAFTETFLARAQFVCDLVVYLFAEREKGSQRDGTDSRLYVEFFVQKLTWELDVVRRIGSERPLCELNGEYADWLTDRILDGEVLL